MQQRRTAFVLLLLVGVACLTLLGGDALPELQGGRASPRLLLSLPASWTLDPAVSQAPHKKIATAVPTAGSQQETIAGSKSSPPVELTSSLKLYSSRGQRGARAQARQYYYYGWENVRFTAQKLDFYGAPGTPPALWVDTLSLNYSLPKGNVPGAPTGLIVKAPKNERETGIERHYVQVAYSKAPGNISACKGWVEKPAFLVQPMYSRNIFHMFSEGIMAPFQTLREQRLLPLIEVDDRGIVREVVEGMGKKCPVAHDAFNRSNVNASCPPHSGALATTSCTPGLDPWCRPGIWSANRESGPLLLAYSKRPLNSQWSHFLRAMSTDVGALHELEGYCFRKLFIGATNTLDFYHATSKVASRRADRVEALRVFKAFARSAEQEWALKQAASGPQGYQSRRLERFRQGIGPEDIDLARHILPFNLPQGSAAGPEQLHRLWKAAMATNQTYEPAELAAPKMEAEHTRPTVTYIARSFSRAVLNQHDILHYILSRYNVTVKVTTLQEPLLDAMELLRKTDVLIGMHGAGWTNVLFIKPRAAVIQLFPYGWRLPHGGPIRDYYQEMALASECHYQQWFSERPEFAFFREDDFKTPRAVQEKLTYHLHPHRNESRPQSWDAHAHWVYQNTWVDLASLGPVIDKAFNSVGIPRLS